MSKLVFNDTLMSPEKEQKMLTRLFNHKILTANGGYLFRYTYNKKDQYHYIALSPGFRDGERMYHHNLKFPFQPIHELIGGISTSGKLNAVFKENKVTAKIAAEYLTLYRQLCTLIPRNALLHLEFDYITKHILNTYLSLDADSPADLISPNNRKNAHSISPEL